MISSVELGESSENAFSFYDLEKNKVKLKIKSPYLSFLFSFQKETHTHLVFQTFASEENVVGGSKETWVQYSVSNQEFLSAEACIEVTLVDNNSRLKNEAKVIFEKED